MDWLEFCFFVYDSTELQGIAPVGVNIGTKKHDLPMQIIDQTGRLWLSVEPL
jgi:hypothetical protein